MSESPMPQLCSICSHPERIAIEAAIIAGLSLRNIAEQFRPCSATALHRHKNNCLKAALQTAQVERQEQITAQRNISAWNAVATMAWMHDEALSIYKEVRSTKDYRFSLQSLAEIRKQTELFSELLQGTEPGVQEAREQEWINLREIIFSALEPYPEARLAVARALLALDQNNATNAS